MQSLYHSINSITQQLFRDVNLVTTHAVVSSSDDSVSVAVIIGAVVGTLLLTIVIIIIIMIVMIVCRRRKKSRRADDKNFQLSSADLPQQHMHNNSGQSDHVITLTVMYYHN